MGPRDNNGRRGCGGVETDEECGSFAQFDHAGAAYDAENSTPAEMMTTRSSVEQEI